MLPAASLYELTRLLAHEGAAPHAAARRLASELCLRHLPTHDGSERAPLQGSLRGGVAVPPPELVTQLETRAAFDLLESAPGLIHQHTLRRALAAPSLGDSPLAAHQASPRAAPPTSPAHPPPAHHPPPTTTSTTTTTHSLATPSNIHSGAHLPLHALPCPLRQVGTLLQLVGVDERGFISLEAFNASLSVLPAMADGAPPPGRLARCLSLFRRKKGRLQYQEQPSASPASEFSGDG